MFHSLCSLGEGTFSQDLPLGSGEQGRNLWHPVTLGVRPHLGTETRVQMGGAAQWRWHMASWPGPQMGRLRLGRASHPRG